MILFGSNGIIASQIALSGYEIVFWRTLIGVFISSKKPVICLDNDKHFVFLILSGAAMGISWIFLYESYQLIGVSLSTLAYYCGPVLVMGFTQEQSR